MKLINFFEFESFNTLKSSMGLPCNIYGSLSFSMNYNPLTEFEIEQLTSVNGLDINVKDLVILRDGTLTYKNTRVILYIRDIASYSNSKNSNPKFHLANCSTLQDMHKNNKFNRYVVSTNTSGNFLMHYHDNSQHIVKQETKLDVCKNCLNQIRFNGYTHKLSELDKDKHVTNFTIVKFFEIYPQSLHNHLPKYNSDNAPINEYSKDWISISNNMRHKFKFICQECNIDLSSSHLNKYLHVHHINSLKYDNSPNNLKVLCIYCHGLEYNHSHVRMLADYSEFIKIKNTICTHI